MRRAALLLLTFLLAGCGDGALPAASTPTTKGPSGAAPPAKAPPAAGPVPPPSTAPPAKAPPPAASVPPPPLQPARCPPDADPGCTAHTGIVLTVESVDPDGDGDLHVIAAGGSITAPGITVLDVSRSLRPPRDPRPGDRVTGAGPVYRGSFRQRQIEVTSFRVARLRR